MYVRYGVLWPSGGTQIEGGHEEYGKELLGPEENEWKKKAAAS
jgi:hypothetical protein